ncbi:unnamed protein product, partial [Ectocarpus sp. 6 AP-2014]
MISFVCCEMQEKNKDTKRVNQTLSMQVGKSTFDPIGAKNQTRGGNKTPGHNFSRVATEGDSTTGKCVPAQGARSAYADRAIGPLKTNPPLERPRAHPKLRLLYTNISISKVNSPQQHSTSPPVRSMSSGPHRDDHTEKANVELSYMCTETSQPGSTPNTCTVICLLFLWCHHRHHSAEETHKNHRSPRGVSATTCRSISSSSSSSGSNSAFYTSTR